MELPQVPIEAILPTAAAIVLIFMWEGVKFFFLKKASKLKVDLHLEEGLPGREKDLRESLMRERTELLDLIEAIRQDEANCRRQLRRTEHRLANAQTGIMGLQRKLGIPISDFDEGWVDEVIEPLPEVKEARLREIRKETGSDHLRDWSPKK